MLTKVKRETRFCRVSLFPSMIEWTIVSLGNVYGVHIKTSEIKMAVPITILIER